MDRSAVMDRALVPEIPALNHLLDVVGDVRPEVIAAQRQLTDRDLGVPDVEQHHGLHVVDVVYPEPVELKLDNFQVMPVKPLNQRDDLKIVVAHVSSVSSQPYNDRPRC